MSNALRPIFKYATCILISASLGASAANADYTLNHEDLPDAIMAYVYLLHQDPGLAHQMIERADPKKGDADIRNVFGKLAAQFRSMDHDILRGLGFVGNSCKIQSQSQGFFCGDNGDHLSNLPYAALMYVTTPIAADNGEVIVILSGLSPEGTKIISFPKNGVPHVIYDFSDRFRDSNICVTGKDMSPLRTIYSVQVAGPGLFTMRESGNVPSREGEDRITLKLAGGKCSISAKTIIPMTLP